MRTNRHTNVAALFCFLALLPGLLSAEPLSPLPSNQSWRNDVVYQVMLDRFYDGDLANNDPETKDPLRYRNGDLKGLIQKLPYIKGLGATSILLNPIVKGGAYHGYSVSDPFRVDPHYGTLDDYRELLRRAHEQGLRVIFDLVLNHMSGDAPLVKQHPDWFRPVAQPGAINDGIDDTIWPFVTFYVTRDFNHENEEAYQYLLGVAKFWIEVGVDGFRFDAVTLGAPAFWKRLSADISKFAPANFLMLGEIFTESQDRLNKYLPAFNAFFDFPYFQTFNDVVMHGAHPAYLRTLLSLDQLYSRRDLLPFTFIDNHDVSRYASRIEGLEREKLALSFMFMFRGVPTILYGTEIGLQDDPTLADQDWDRSRSSMIFSDNEKHALYQHLKSLIEIRKKYRFPESSRFDIVDRALEKYWVSIIKDPQGHFVVAMFNFSPEPATGQFYRLHELGIPQSGVLKPLVGGGTSVELKKGLVPFNLKPYESRFYVLESPATS
ncbi:MAG: hypothetical protein J0M12_13485 [Deltaproteobacteria bacterium]|nr:hypothetical protein [Deltaproteobacteria bacterium]